MDDVTVWNRVLPHPVDFQRTDGYGNVYTFHSDVYLRGDQKTESYRSGRTLDEVKTEADLQRLARSDSGFGLMDRSVHDNGHEFFTRRRTIKCSHEAVRIDDPDSKISYKGPLVPASEGYVIPSDRFRDVGRLTSSSVNTYGTRAIRATAPTHPNAGLATFLGELREQLPTIIGTSLLRDRSNYFRSLGSEYLNVEFGWKPFISDVRKMLTSVVESSRTLAQYERDAGKIVRRRFSFPTIVETDQREYNPGGSPYEWTEHPYNSIYGAGNSPVVSLLRYLETRYWFSGAYTYTLAEGDSTLSRFVKYEQLGNKLLGTRLTPEVLWELTPWSWLADWVGNLGDIITNQTLLSQDGLVMRYGYLMRQITAKDTYMPVHPVFKIGGPGHATMQLSVIQKERARATPFGFGLDTSQFTGRQWAILAALGLSKGNRSLW